MNLPDANALAHDLVCLKGAAGTLQKKELAHGWISPKHKVYLDLVGNINRQWFVTWDGVLKAAPGEEPEGLLEVLYAAEHRLATPSDTAAKLKALLNVGWPEVVLRTIVEKTLDAGITVASIKKVLGEHRKFSPALCADWCDMSLKKKERLLSEGRYASTPKMDGLRCLIRLHTHDQGAYSRHLKPLKNMDGHVAALAKMFPFPCVVDGEAFACDGTWNSSVSGAKKTGSKVQMQFYPFDMVPLSEIETQNYKLTSEERWNMVLDHLAFGDESMFVEVMRRPVKTVADVEAEHRLCLEEGWEGAVLHNLDAPYSCHRSIAWVKVKSWKSSEFTVVDLIAGRGKHHGRLGAMLVRGQCEGRLITCEVGTGFSDQLREEIWNNKTKYIGYVAEVKYFEVTEGSLRFPSFLRWREDLM
jgi:DNA ligase-1